MDASKSKIFEKLRKMLGRGRRRGRQKWKDRNGQTARETDSKRDGKQERRTARDTDSKRHGQQDIQTARHTDSKTYGEQNRRTARQQDRRTARGTDSKTDGHRDKTDKTRKTKRFLSPSPGRQVRGPGGHPINK